MIYEPAEDSFLLESQVKKYVKNKSLLDMGSGSGIISLSAIKNKAKSVLASDINPEVINLLKFKGIKCVKSDLFERIHGKFDIISFNPPYLPLDSREDKESRVATTGGKEGDEIILKFLKQAESHLNKNGIILLLLSSLTPRENILSLLKKLSLKKARIAEKKVFFESLEVWKISQI